MRCTYSVVPAASVRWWPEQAAVVWRSGGHSAPEQIGACRDSAAVAAGRTKSWFSKNHVQNSTVSKHIQNDIPFPLHRVKVSSQLPYWSNLDGLRQGQLGDGCGCRGWDAGPGGAILLAGWVLHSGSQELSLGLLDQQLLLRWGQGQLRSGEGDKKIDRETCRKIRKLDRIRIQKDRK